MTVHQQPIKNPYPWYDSLWLGAFVNAKRIVKLYYPKKLKEFIGAFDPLKTRPDFQVQKYDSVLEQTILLEAQALIHSLSHESLEKQEFFKFGRMVVHDHSYFNQLQESLTELVSDAVQEPLESSYNFLSFYNNLGVCNVHMDAPSAKWTLDICLDQSAPWPIYFSQVKSWPETFHCEEKNWAKYIKTDPDNVFSEFNLDVGEAVLFSGSSQWHFRERMPNLKKTNYCSLAFFHYIPKGSRVLTEPEKWAVYFDMPELAVLADIHTTRITYTMSDVVTAKKS